MAVILLALAAGWVSTTFVDRPAAAQTAAEVPVTVVVTADTTGDVTEAENPAADAEMTAWKAAILGVVEGVTEYLPVSSTGHLVVTQRILGIGDDDATKDAADTYAIAIQFGAILAVLGLYWTRIKSLFMGLVGRDDEGRRLLIALVVAFLPAVVIGVLFEGPIKDNLLGPGPVIAAWLVGGIALLWLAPKILPDRPGLAVTEIGWRQALIIGCAQVLAMWPGTSRSLVTLLAAFAIGATLAAAVEFSFLLGLMTLGAATLYETAKNGSQVIDAYGWVDPLVGMVAAFVSAVLAVRWMVKWLQTRSLAIFGWERLVVAAITVVLIVTGVIAGGNV